MLAPLLPPEDVTWTLPDGYRARGYVFRPTASPRTLLLYLHGIQSHGGWYQRSASLLSEGGHLVVQPDRRGSGRNERDRGDATSPEQWLDDLDAIVADARERWGPLPIGLVGVSWGGKLAAAYALSGRCEIVGSLLIAPGIFPKVNVPLHERLRIAGSYATGGRSTFEIPLSDPTLFTENEQGQAFIVDDPLRLTHATARFLIHSTRLDRRVRRARVGSLADGQHQLLLASEDGIIDNRLSASWAERVGMPCETLSGRHTLEFARDPAVFEAAITKWAGNLLAK